MMSVATEPPPMTRKKRETRPVEMAKLDSAVLRDARIVVAMTGEGLSEYLSRLLAPAVARDKRALMRKELPGDEPKK
jgi:hypothetical protein